MLACAVVRLPLNRGRELRRCWHRTRVCSQQWLSAAEQYRSVPRQIFWTLWLVRFTGACKTNPVIAKAVGCHWSLPLYVYSLCWPWLWPWPWPWFSPYPTGHIGPHSDAILVCQELPPLLPPRWTPSFVGLCWLRPSSSLLVDLVLSCIMVPASTVLAVIFAGAPYRRHVQASEVIFFSVCCPWFVVQFWLWPPH